MPKKGTKTSKKTKTSKTKISKKKTTKPVVVIEEEEEVLELSNVLESSPTDDETVEEETTQEEEPITTVSVGGASGEEIADKEMTSYESFMQFKKGFKEFKKYFFKDVAKEIKNTDVRSESKDQFRSIYESFMVMCTVVEKPLKKDSKKNKPKKKYGRSAYILFGMHIRPIIKEEMPELSNTDIMREIGRRWKLLTDEEKQPFKDAAAAEKAALQANP